MSKDDDGPSPLTLPITSLAARLARRHVATVGASWPADLRDLALLLTSELVTAALRYGNGGGICLTVRQTPHVLRVEVDDANPRAPELSRNLDGTAERGRGLHIIDSLATRWDTRHPGSGRQDGLVRTPPQTGSSRRSLRMTFTRPPTTIESMPSMPGPRDRRWSGLGESGARPLRLPHCLGRHRLPAGRKEIAVGTGSLTAVLGLVAARSRRSGVHRPHPTRG